MKKRTISVLAVIIAVFLIGGYITHEVPRPEQTPIPQPKVETVNWKTYTNTQYGFELNYPENYSIETPAQSSDYPAVVDISYKDPQRQTLNLQLMRISVDSISKPDSFEEYLKMHPLRNANSGKEYSFKDFTQREIGNITFYSILTERFEGTLAFDYYTIVNKKVFIFHIQSEGVAWSNPQLNVENDTYHVIFRQILSTFKVNRTFVPITVMSPNGGETFKAGQHVTIKWKNNASYSALNKVNVMVVAGTTDKCYEYTNNGSMASCRGYTIYNGPNTGSFDWTVPTEYPDAGDYLIRIWPDGGYIADDYSDSFFTIAE